jgi:hypothetical protein
MTVEEVLCLGEQQKQVQRVIFDWISRDNHQVHGLLHDQKKEGENYTRREKFYIKH